LCDIFLNVDAPNVDKCYDPKHDLHEELERAFDEFPKYYTVIL